MTALDGRPAPELADALARATISRDLEHTLFVEAGAGSGKTTSLVERVVALVAAGVSIDSIAAITFTEAAASELRIRVRDRLEAEGVATQDKKLLTAASAVETAPITTLHGFALRILLQFPIEAGLPPGFDVVDEISSILEFDEAWRVFVGAVGDDLELLELQARASALDLQLRHFPEVARRFDDNWDLLDRVDRDPPPLSPIDLTAVLDGLDEALDLRHTCPFEDDKYALAMAAVADQVNAIRSQDPLDQVQLIPAMKAPARNVGRKANWSEPSLDSVKDAVSAAVDAVHVELNRLRNEVLAHFIVLVADFVADRVANRQSRGELSFHDLLVLARRLLRSNEQVRFRLHQTYTRLLLDEFQDTDPIQIELAVLLASTEPAASRHWTDLARDIPAGRLVVVGDPKQSIYRFRRADIGVYSEAERSLVQQTTDLVTNFRSVPGIVDFVNHLFGRAIGEGEEGAQPVYTPLVAHREPGDAAAVVVIGHPHDDLNASEIRAEEATDIAALVCTMVAEAQSVFRDGQWLPVRLQDIAVLIPSRLSLPALESAFSSVGLPFRPETSSLVYATQEVRDVLAGVRAVVDPASPVDVVAALRSSLFAVDDDELVAWKTAGGSWDYRVHVPAELQTTAIADAYDVLLAWHEQRWWLEPSSLVDQIVRDRCLREQALASTRPRDRWRRYRFLAEQAREFAAVQGGDLHDFVRWVEIQSSDMARVTEPIPAEPDDDAVRILTVHGSKGLEFPVAILAGASTQEKSRQSGPTVLFTDVGPQVRLGKDRSTEGFDVHASVEEVLDRHERVRLHYVAATRARDVLVVSAHHKASGSSMGRRTHELLEDRPDLWDAFERTGTEVFEATTPTQLRLEEQGFDEERRLWTASQHDLIELSGRANSRSATGVAKALSDHDGTGAEPDPEREPWRRGRAGSAVGSAVHAVLQDIDLATGDGLEELAALHAETEGVLDLRGQVAELVRAALATPTVREAAESRHWRELHLAVPADLGVLEGYVDLLYETDEGLVVVDYKTDAAGSEANIERLLESYRYQGAAYALALEELTGKPVVDCRFLFLSPRVERSLPNLQSAVAEVRQELGRHT